MLEQAIRKSRKTKIYLVWDMFRSHLTENSKENLRQRNTDMDVIP